MCELGGARWVGSRSVVGDGPTPHPPNLPRNLLHSPHTLLPTLANTQATHVQGRANPIQLTDPHTCRRDHTSDGSMAFEHQAEGPEQLRQVCLDRRHEPALHHQGRPEQHAYPRRYFGVKISCARCPNASPSASHPSRKPTSLRSSLLLPLAYTQAISRYSGTCRSPS